MVAVSSDSYGTVAQTPITGSRRVSRKVIAALLGAGLAVVAVIALISVNSGYEFELLNYDEKNAGFPQWSHPVLPPVNDRSEVNSRWSYKSDSPPYLAPITIYSGDGAEKSGSANYVRRLLGVKVQWRFKNWNTNSFVTNFESEQMRFLSRNKNSFMIIPPLTEMPVLSGSAARLLNNYLLYGHNTIVVCGSVSSVLFLNENLPSWDFYGYNLDASWHTGPYEQQKTTIGSRFDKTAVTLPGDNVWGVNINSLPREAISYYEGPGVSVVFALPAKTGKIIYIGYNFEQPNAAWAEILQAAVRGTAM